MNRMIALWAHPRSRSTVLERVFIERGDFEVFHEPFAHVAFNERSAIPHDDLNCGLPPLMRASKPCCEPPARDNMCFIRTCATTASMT